MLVEVVYHESFLVGAVPEHFFCLLAACLEVSGYIFHVFQECYAEPFHWKFFRPVHGPVSICQIVMVHTAELLDAGISAMMVGHQQTFVGDDFSGASSSELHYRILEGRVVDAVNLVRAQAASCLFESLSVHFLQQREHPHSFVCPDSRCKYCQDSQKTNKFLHIMSVC